MVRRVDVEHTVGAEDAQAYRVWNPRPGLCFSSLTQATIHLFGVGIAIGIGIEGLTGGSILTKPDADSDTDPEIESG